MVGIELVQDPQTLQPFPHELGFGVKVGRSAILKEKMLVRYSPAWVALAPPFIVTEEQIDDMVDRLGRAIVAVLNQVRV
jgi:adenosylmethionine-8-amino-7-oxononanoate aminotransferase